MNVGKPRDMCDGAIGAVKSYEAPQNRLIFTVWICWNLIDAYISLQSLTFCLSSGDEVKLQSGWNRRIRWTEESQESTTTTKLVILVETYHIQWELKHYLAIWRLTWFGIYTELSWIKGVLGEGFAVIDSINGFIKYVVIRRYCNRQTIPGQEPMQWEH